MFFLACGFSTKRGLVKKGNDAFHEKRYRQALTQYEKAQIKDPDSPAVRYNLGNAFYELNSYRDADRAYRTVLEKDVQDKQFKAKALYNYGNVQYRLGQFDRAIAAYKDVLDLNPDDEDAKYNLEVLQKKKAEFDKKQENRQKQEKDQPKKDQQQQQEKQQQGGGHENQEQEQESSSQGSKNESKSRDEGSQSEKQGTGEEQTSAQAQSKEGTEPLPQPPGENAQKHKRQDDQQNMELENSGAQQQFPQDSSGGDPNTTHRDGSSPFDERLDPKGLPSRPMGITNPSGQSQSEGRMSTQQALQILNAMQQAERDILILRRPSPHNPKDKTVDKDW